MSDPTPLPVAVEGETIEGADLQPSIDDLLAMAAALAALIPNAPDVDAVRELGRAELALMNQATALATAQVKVLAGEARVSAEHVNAAAAYAKGVVATIASWQKAVRVAGEVVAFFVAVQGGQGGAIVKSATALKGELDAA